MRPGAILFDLDGTIYQGTMLIPGTVETLSLLKDAKIPFRFITNITRMTKKKLVLMLKNMGLSISTNDIFTAPQAAALYCDQKGYKKIILAVSDLEIAEDFANFQLVHHNPEAIVLGDMGNGFTFDFINTMFNHILRGAELIALHKNHYWKSEEGYTMDVGGFVAALEYASGKPASVMGKPSLNLFVLAAMGWNLPNNKILMVGDDIGGDIGGAANAGMKSVLVKTGKFRNENLCDNNIKPNYIIDSIADLPNIIKLN